MKVTLWAGDGCCFSALSNATLKLHKLQECAFASSLLPPCAGAAIPNTSSVCLCDRFLLMNLPDYLEQYDLQFSQTACIFPPRPIFPALMCYRASFLLVAHRLPPLPLAKLTVMRNHLTLNNSTVWGNPDHRCLLCLLLLPTSHWKVKTHATTVLNPEGGFMAT